MNIGNQISTIRKEQQLTQEQFGALFHVTRQTVSNWENEKRKINHLIFRGCRHWNYCILPAFTRFHTPNGSNHYWTYHDWNWLV